MQLHNEVGRTQTNTEPKVLLLPHSKAERVPRRDEVVCEWLARTAPHRRKYLGFDGEARTRTGRAVNAALELWTEYEAPTIAERSLASDEGLPRFVHKISVRPGLATLNTDPWIFHRGFVWTICRHERNRRVIDNLRGGDIVLFGSPTAGKWLLDTAFVVKRRFRE